MLEKLREIFASDFVLSNARDASLLIGAVVPIIGVFLVIGRRTILALALPQISTFGVAVTVSIATMSGYAVGEEHNSAKFLLLALIGAFLAMGAAIMWQFIVERRFKTPADAETGTAYAFAAAGILVVASSNLVPELGLLEVLRGDVLAVPDGLLRTLEIGFLVILFLLFVFSRGLHSVLYDPILAFTAGFSSRLLSLLTIGLISLTIALGGLCAGPLSIFAFLVIPPVTFLPVARHIGTLYMMSAITGAVCAIGGFWISYSFESITFPIASAQILLLCAIWLIVRLATIGRFVEAAHD